MSERNNLIKLIQLLQKSIEGKSISFSERFQDKPYIVHYYNEIIRYWSKLNYAINKTLRALDIKKEFNTFRKASFLYLAYRILFEGKQAKLVFDELKTNDIYFKKDFERNIFQQVGFKLKNFSWEIALEGKTEQENLSILESIPTFFYRN